MRFDTRPAFGATRLLNRAGSALRMGAAAVLAMTLASAAQAFPSLDLTPGIPDIESAFITVDYIGNSNDGNLTASGFAQVLTPPGSPSGNIAGGTFDIFASIQENALTASGTLDIGGTIASQGFNSGTLLTGTLSALGGGAGDPLEFLFDITGGDAAGIFGGIGATAGVILSQSGYNGSFGSGFTSGPFQALADTFGTTPVPVPGTLGLLLVGSALVASRHRRTAAARA